MLFDPEDILRRMVNTKTKIVQLTQKMVKIPSLQLYGTMISLHLVVNDFFVEYCPSGEISSMLSIRPWGRLASSWYMVDVAKPNIWRVRVL